MGVIPISQENPILGIPNLTIVRVKRSKTIEVWAQPEDRPDTRNIKPFDGAEVQLLNAAAKRVQIDVNDPSLGVLVKFKFKDPENPILGFTYWQV